MYIASPIRFQATIDDSNLCTLNWQPPNITKRHGTIQHYLVNCSTEDMREGNWTVLATNTTTRLQPYQFYNCCVAAVNEAGRGNLSCQTIITHEAGTVTVDMLYVINYTSLINFPSCSSNSSSN